MTKKIDYRNEHPLEYEQGQRARLSSINEQDSPYDADHPMGKAWRAGYDDAEGAAERDKTMLPEETVNKAEGQVKTGSEANKK